MTQEKRSEWKDLWMLLKANASDTWGSIIAEFLFNPNAFEWRADNERYFQEQLKQFDRR